MNLLLKQVTNINRSYGGEGQYHPTFRILSELFSGNVIGAAV